MKNTCPYFKECGGCSLLDVPYEKELLDKKSDVEKLFRKINYKKPIEIVKSLRPFYYRNKVQLAFKLSKTKKVVSGIYEEHSHKIVVVDDCLIQAEVINRVLKNINIALTKNKILPFVDGGVLKHVLVRYAFSSNEIMVVFVTSSEIFNGRNNVVKTLLKLEPGITTIVQNIQPRDTVIVLGTKEKVLYGKGFIIDELCGNRFKLSSRSFYQINPIQTEKLYNIAIEFANLSKEDNVIDSYSGIGTIGLCASKKARQVICVENNPDAVKDAKFNAKFNNCNNILFHCEDSTRFLTDLALSMPKIDCIFLDPPRTGTTVEFIEAISKLKIKKVVYVSCNPETLVRDLEVFNKLGYEINKVKCVDMFSKTPHVETIVLLEAKQAKK